MNFNTTANATTWTGTLTTAGTNYVRVWTPPHASPGDPAGVREPRRPRPPAPANTMALSLPGGE